MRHNTDILCPTTQEVCPALERTYTLYTGNADQVDPEVALRDKALFAVRRMEHIGNATLRSCEGVAEEGTCPTRVAMNESRVRRGLISVVRSALGRG